MLLRRGFANLHFGRILVMDLPSQIVAIAQTKHSTGSGNPDGHAQRGKLYWLPILALMFVCFFFSFFFLKKKRERETDTCCYPLEVLGIFQFEPQSFKIGNLPHLKFQKVAI
jgi:hypothetical protein